MAQTAKRAATYADLVAASDLLVAEIIFGRLVTHRRGDPRHNWTLASLLHALAPVVWNESRHPLGPLWRFSLPPGATLSANRKKD